MSNAARRHDARESSDNNIAVGGGFDGCLSLHYVAACMSYRRFLFLSMRGEVSRYSFSAFHILAAGLYAEPARTRLSLPGNGSRSRRRRRDYDYYIGYGTDHDYACRLRLVAIARFGGRVKYSGRASQLLLPDADHASQAYAPAHATRFHDATVSHALSRCSGIHIPRRLPVKSFWR